MLRYVLLSVRPIRWVAERYARIELPRGAGSAHGNGNLLKNGLGKFSAGCSVYIALSSLHVYVTLNLFT